MDIKEITISDALEKMESGEMTALSLLEACLKNIAEQESDIQAFLEVWEEDARAQAVSVDERRASGKPVGMLAGIPIAIKDNMLWVDHTASGASKILEPYKAAYSATVVERLLDEDAVLIGRTNLDEFACGGSTENSGFGPTHNPHDPTRVPGGSSGGSAAAVASGMCLAALGSDTGGSVRQPASFCGVVGLKPTYGSVSRYGLMSMSSSLDQIGPLAKTVDGCARVFGVIEGKDVMDATSVDHPPTVVEGVAHGEDDTSLKDITIGVPKEYFEAGGIDEAVAEQVKTAIASLEERGATIKEVSLPNTKYALAAYYVLMPSEVSSNTARYDGVRYGLSKGDSLDDVYVDSRTEGFGAEVKRRILLGAFSLSAGYSDEYYKKSVGVQKEISNDFMKAFDQCDVIIGPTSPVTAFKLGERIADPITMYLSDVYTVSANLAGIPAISAPCGEANSMPVGIQLMTPHFREDRLLHVASLIKQ